MSKICSSAGRTNKCSNQRVTSRTFDDVGVKLSDLMTLHSPRGHVENETLRKPFFPRSEY